MTALTWIAVALLCIGWLALLIFSLSSKSEQNIHDKQPISLASKTRHRNLSNNDTFG